MRYVPLTLADCEQWADLLAISFGHTSDEMQGLLSWLSAGWPVIAWGAWDGEKLAAQYSCRLVKLKLPGSDRPVTAGMSINMAVRPDYRGQGLIKHVARPVYQVVAERGGIGGVGFSNLEGVQVDLKSKSYGYQVVGKMTSTLVWLSSGKFDDSLILTDKWPDKPFTCSEVQREGIHFTQTPELIEHRFARHPFRHYQFGIWQEDDSIKGIVVYRPVQFGILKGAALLAAYSPDLPGLLQRWARVIRQEWMRFVHVLTSPQSALHHELSRIGYAVDVPYNRSPYFLTAKSFGERTPPELFDFTRWDCMGGDVL